MTHRQSHNSAPQATNPGTLFSGKRRILGLALLLMVCSLFVLDRLYPLALPSHAGSFARVVVDRDGRPLRAFADASGIWRYEVKREQVADNYLTALLNYEDRWFYYHPGVNPFSMLRALGQNLWAGHIVSGGSTLTMQVARLLHPHSRSIGGKLYQILRALQLEWHLDKNEILDLYLNHAPFGGAREGVQAASYQYLGKPASQLTRAESALLAVLPQSPTRFRPDRYPERAQQARDKLLRRMLSLGVWTAEQVEDARLERVVAYTPERPMLAPLLARRLVREFPDQAVIDSTIDADLQRALQTLAADYVSALPHGSSSAVLVVDDASHEVLAYLGTARFAEVDSYGHVDMLQAVRSPGSTLKPFLYGLAMDAGLVHSESLLADTPRLQASYRPANFSGLFQGPVSVRQALQQSLNVPAVELMEQLGPATFADKLRNAGIDLTLPGVARPSAAIILGGVGVTLQDLVRGYGALSDDGLVRPLRYTKRATNDQARYLLSPGAAWIVRDMLKGIPRPGRIRSQSTRDKDDGIGWKSGTSYGFRDAWAIGFNGRYRVGVWIGRPDGTPMPGHYGALTAAPLMFSVFDMLGNTSAAPDPAPPSVSEAEICWPLGTRRSEQRADWCQRRRTAWILDSSVPRTLPDRRNPALWQRNPFTFFVNPASGLLVDASCPDSTRQEHSVALWPQDLEAWVARPYRRRHAIPATDPACPYPLDPLADPLVIDGIGDGNIYHATSTGGLPELAASARGCRGRCQWYLNGEQIADAADLRPVAIQPPRPGANQLIVIDEVGNLARVEFEVLRQ